MNPKPSPWWTPDVHADRRPFLLGRARIQAALRQWFEERGFLEADPAIMQVSPGNEAHLHAFATELAGVDGGALGRLYLHTSPEFACKKLLAAGETRLFTFAHVFRNRERGPLHHPEFTMLEWYRVEQPYGVVMADAAALVDAGAFAVVLELVPMSLAQAVTARLAVPTIGIGAGAGCDGQVQVWHDILALYSAFVPKHAKQYAQIGEEIREAIGRYAREVRSGEFPTPKESFRMDEKVLQELAAGQV